jgi:hypothetical protein
LLLNCIDVLVLLLVAAACGPAILLTSAALTAPPKIIAQRPKA